VSLCRSEGAQSMRGSIADSVQALHKRTAGTALAGKKNVFNRVFPHWQKNCSTVF
jgi:hypothetical protein